MGNFRFYLCPPGLIPVADVPEGWGLLYCYDKRITVEKHPKDHNESAVRAEEYHLLYSIARRVVLRGLMPKVLELEGVWNDYSMAGGE